MRTSTNSQKATKAGAISALELRQGVIESEPKRLGRRLFLKFIGGDHPELDRIQFCWSEPSRVFYWQQGDPPEKSPMTWSPVPQALALIFLDYLGTREKIGPTSFYEANSGSLANALGNAMSDKDGKLHELITEWLPGGSPISRVKKVFAGKNSHGRGKGERRIFVNSDYLPPNCIEVCWVPSYPSPITDTGVLRELARRIRKSLGIPEGPTPPVGEGVAVQKLEPPPPPAERPASPVRQPLQRRAPIPKTATELFAEPQGEPISSPKPKAEPSLESQKGALSGWLAAEIGDVVEAVKKRVRGTPPPEKPSTSPPRERPTLVYVEPKGFTSQKSPEAQPEPVLFKYIAPKPPPPIDPSLFEVPDTGGNWPDGATLLEFQVDGEPHPWTLKNSFESVLILGASGSGKTSGSGATIARTYLRSGFGGLVLTAKEDEADHWRRLCAECGREEDLIIVTRDGPWKLNLLAYEAQRPGRAQGLADNLTAFCVNLLSISNRSKGPQMNEQFWRNATNELLTSTFELFLISRMPISFDLLADFIDAAPQQLPATEADWLKIPLFGSVVKLAHERRATEEDHRMFQKAMTYWRTRYAKLPGKARVSILQTISGMLSAFRGRDLPGLISSETTVTPESIMSGKIVVLDLPTNVFHHAGLLIQSAWKYHFQTSIQSHSRTRRPSCQPTFIWEDEGHTFVSDHDHKFQAMARSSRVSRVLLSQNLHGFYQEFGHAEKEAADSILSNLNTKIFHANNDITSNQWASSIIGMELRARPTYSFNQPPPPKDIFDSIRQSFDPPRTAGGSATPQWEPVVRPEEFNHLKTGDRENNYEVEAWVTWVGSSAPNQKHFTKVIFLQR